MHLDNLLFILLIATAALIRLLAKKAGDAAKSKPGTPISGSTSAPRTVRPAAHPVADSDQERIRRFFEALGQPVSSSPPQPIKPRPTFQRPVVLPHLPPSTTPPPLPTAPPPKLVAAVEVVPVFEVQKSGPESEPPAAVTASTPTVEPEIEMEQPASRILALLSSPSGLRDAIILREIFGSPRSLQPLDLIGNA